LHHLKKLAKERQFRSWWSMGGIAASGGYYVAMGGSGEPGTQHFRRADDHDRFDGGSCRITISAVC